MKNNNNLSFCLHLINDPGYTFINYTYVRKVFHHLEQNGFTAANNVVRPAKRYSLEPYLITLNAWIWLENISRYRLTNFENLRYEFLL